jgi:GT2 family glycosyltransferase
MLDANPAMVACHTQFELMDATGGTVLAGYGRRQSYAEMLEGSGICGASTVTVRREALAEVGGFNDDDRPAEDLDLWLRLARTGEIGFIDDVLARYRIHAFSCGK